MPPSCMIMTRLPAPPTIARCVIVPVAAAHTGVPTGAA